MANCVLPEDIMLCILVRLPVKAIFRFKSVCKPWLHLFSTPEFKKLHLDQFSSGPENQSFIVHSFCESWRGTKSQFSIFNIESGKKTPATLDHPFAHSQDIVLDNVGCCNGLVCVRRGQEIVLWNPAMKLAKTVPFKGCGLWEIVSLGFGYDAMRDDFKVVKIVGDLYHIQWKGADVKSVEVYSVYLDSWVTIDVGFQFNWYKDKNDLILNGNPYWFAMVDQEDVLVCFDMTELVFKIVPLPTDYWNGLDEETGTEADLIDLSDLDEDMEIRRDVDLVDWNGALGLVLLTFVYKLVEVPKCSRLPMYCYTRVECLWVFDDIKRIWRRNSTFGQDVGRVLHCTKNEKVLGSLSSGTLFALDLETGCVEELFDRDCLGDNTSFKVYGYTKSWHTSLMGWKSWLRNMSEKI